LWGWGLEGRKIAWTSWKTICEPQEEGGLGILDLKCGCVGEMDLV